MAGIVLIETSEVIGKLPCIASKVIQNIGVIL